MAKVHNIRLRPFVNNGGNHLKLHSFYDRSVDIYNGKNHSIFSVLWHKFTVLAFLATMVKWRTLHILVSCQTFCQKTMAKLAITPLVFSQFLSG